MIILSSLYKPLRHYIHIRGNSSERSMWWSIRIIDIRIRIIIGNMKILEIFIITILLFINKLFKRLFSFFLFLFNFMILLFYFMQLMLKS